MPAILDDNALHATLLAVQSAIAPVWPLQDYIAVNPFLGMSNHKFLEARARLRRVSDVETLMPLSYYRERVSSINLSTQDFAEALAQCHSEYPSLYAHRTVAEFLHLLKRTDVDATEDTDRSFHTVAEVADFVLGSTWSTAITQEISRHLAAHYDRGQATWSSPWKHLPLFSAWLESAKIDRRFERLGAQHFRKLVAQLPPNPTEAIGYLLEKLQIPADRHQDFLLCQAMSISGWSSFVRYQVREAEMRSNSNEDFIGLLAIRLAYDYGLVEAGILSPLQFVEHQPSLLSLLIPESDMHENTAKDGDDELAASIYRDRAQTLLRYFLQVAVENSYRHELGAELVRYSQPSKSHAPRKLAQMVFCIDVRSEVIRRHLEATTDEVETLGFAGFFGLPIEHIPMATEAGSPQCPALLVPSIRVEEQLHDVTPAEQAQATVSRERIRLSRRIVKAFQSSAASSFSFVESFGVAYFAKLISDASGWTRPISNGKFDGVPSQDKHHLRPQLTGCGHSKSDAQGQPPVGLSAQARTELAEGILRNLGLTSNFARLVVLCGHASETVNNPYAAGLDCGACGGHSGESNARVAASLLNDPIVRQGLADRGLKIPTDVRFVGALHNTTTDEIELFSRDSENVAHDESHTESHDADLFQLNHLLKQASKLCREERAKRMGDVAPNKLAARSRDWAQTRPEWGLAGNAAFIVAPRTRTAGLRLDGRTFMHSYDYRQDAEGRVLELIMTAPMVVTSWINLQYYASTVDNLHYGSGNKVIHNVVGQFGVIEGNDGDLTTGLPWQSVHDGQRLQHEPLRLLVVIEAPREAIERVLDKHAHVRNLVENGWISLAAIEENRLLRYVTQGDWMPCDDAAPEAGWHVPVGTEEAIPGIEVTGPEVTGLAVTGLATEFAVR